MVPRHLILQAMITPLVVNFVASFVENRTDEIPDKGKLHGTVKPSRQSLLYY